MLPLIQLTDSLFIPTYYLWISLVCCLLFILAVRQARQDQLPIQIALDLGLLIMLTGFVGARLMHVIYEEPEVYWVHPKRIFQIWEGGFVFFGGALTAAVSSWLYIRKEKLSYFVWADFFAPLLALGYGLGRGSCFLAGCCFGSVCELPWAVNFGDGLLRHPTQVYAMLWELSAFCVLLLLRHRSYFKAKPGLIFSIWMILHGAGRMMMESYRDDFRGANIVGHSISSWIALAVFSAGIVLAYSRSKKT